MKDIQFQLLDTIYNSLDKLSYYSVSRVHSSCGLGKVQNISSWTIEIYAEMRFIIVMSNAGISYIEKHGVASLNALENSIGTYYKRQVNTHYLYINKMAEFSKALKEVLYAIEDKTDTQIDTELFDLLDDILENGY